MLILITYDVSTITPQGRKRLRKVAGACKDYGLRAQKSIFECEIDPGQWTKLKNRLLSIINEEEDSLRFYYLGSNWQRRVEHHGIGEPIDMHGLIMI